MGVNTHIGKWWSDVVNKFDIAWGGSLMEFGNQHFFFEEVGRESPLIPYYDDVHNRRVFKYWVNLLGISHVSIDLNGEDGSLPFDLSTSLEVYEILHNKFDLVTDFGTIEHIPDQYWAWRNMHNFTKSDGIMMHVLPLIGNWLNHPSCYWRYTDDFFENLCSVCDYELVGIQHHMNELSPDISIYATVKKLDNSNFPDEAVFGSLLDRYAEGE